MKKSLLVLTIILLLFPITMSGQSKNSHIQFIGDYEEIIETGLPKDVMWVNLKKWVSSQFNNSKYAVDLDDKESGVLIIKWNSLFSSPTSPYIKLTASASCQIDVKDQKYRIRISDGTVKIDPNMSGSKDLSTSNLQLSIDDLEFVLNVATTYFNSSASWKIDSTYIHVIDKYKSKLSEIPQYKNEKKKKINKEWERIDRDLNILNDIKDGYVAINLLLHDSLIDNIKSVDDF